MIDVSQQVLYLTLAGSIAVFTVFLVWIMYYIAQIAKQSNEMVSDFRVKMEELDESVQQLKDKVSGSVENLATMGEQVAYIVELVGGVTGKRKSKKRTTRKRRSRRVAQDD